MKNKVVEAQALYFEYKRGVPVFNKLSFSIDGGRVVGVLGENGAGKTTLFDLICRVKKPVSGSLNITCLDKEVAYVPQNLTISPAMKIKETVDLISCFQGVGSKNARQKINAFWPDSIKERYDRIKDRRSSSCSYGEKRLVVTAAVLAMNDSKKLFILDEPTAGVDVQYRFLMWEMIQKIKNEEKTIIVSSHILEEIGRNTDCFLFLKRDGVEDYSSMSDFVEKYSAESPDEAFVKATVIT